MVDLHAPAFVSGEINPPFTGIFHLFFVYLSPSLFSLNPPYSKFRRPGSRSEPFTIHSPYYKYYNYNNSINEALTHCTLFWPSAILYKILVVLYIIITTVYK